MSKIYMYRYSYVYIIILYIHDDGDDYHRSDHFAGFVTAYWPKTLLVHGLNDTTVPDTSSKELARALKHKGNTLSFVLFSPALFKMIRNRILMYLRT